MLTTYQLVYKVAVPILILLQLWGFAAVSIVQRLKTKFHHKREDEFFLNDFLVLFID